MEKKSAIGLIVLAFMVVVLLSAPAYARASVGHVSVPLIAAVPGAAHATPSAPAPTTTFPRTVLVETFTGQWCIYCEMESQVLYAIQHSYSPSVVVVGELHVCYSPTSCGDAYPTADGTANTRASYYAVSAFPDVFFDGAHSVLGAASTNDALQAAYEGLINNASAIPANVSISQAATVSSSTVISFANITSGITGSYHAISYLIEYIGLNDTNRHNIDYVVRGSLVDQTVSLVAGETLRVGGSELIGSTWNVQRLSVITLVQERSSKIIQNTNMVPVTTLSTAVAVNQTAATSGAASTVTVRVVNSSTSAPVVGATVSLTSSNGGTLSPATGVTAGDGTFTATFTAPTVSSPETTVIWAQVSAPGYTSGSGSTSLTLNPLILSSVPGGLSVAPGGQQVSLAWAAPDSGSAGVTYYVYRATSETGTYTPVGISTSTGFVDTNLVDGQSYWYTVSAHNAAGFSANTTAIAAIALTASTQGLPPYTGWWLDVDSVKFNSATNASLALHLPEGSFGYEFGPNSYAFLATEPSGSVAVAGVPVSMTLSFVPRYASLEGTVSPATAIVTVGGTEISVVDGSFSWFLEAGTYTAVVTAPGYEPNTTSVTLTPGNTTTMAVTLDPVPASSAASSSDWLGGNAMLTIAVIAIIGIPAVLGGAMLLSRRGKQRQPPRARAAPTSTSGSPPRNP